MRLNPLEYDVRELRDAAGITHADSTEGDDLLGRPLPGPDVVRWAREYRELSTFDEKTADGEAYLETLPTDYRASMFIIDWLDFLVDHAGVQGTMQALDYYRDIGWLSQSAERELRRHLAGVNQSGDTDGFEALGARGHRRSLLYLAKVAAFRNDD